MLVRILLHTTRAQHLSEHVVINVTAGEICSYN